MSNLPDTWEQVDFDDAVNVVSDRGLRIKQKDYLPSGSLAVVDQGEGLVGGYTNDLGARVESAGPVIVFGDHTRRFKYVRFPFAVGADGVKLLAANAAWNPEFLFHQLATLDLEDRGYGRHFQFLRKERLAMPPIAEQTRIVAKLEELLSDLDAGVAELKAAQKKLQQYRQSLLKGAVEGALTAPWREAQRKLGTPTETGAQLLQRILTERRARWEAKQLAKFKEQGKAPPKDWQKKYPEPAAPDTTGLPGLPEGWVWASVEQLSTVVTDGVHKKPNYLDSGVPFLTVKNLTAGHGISFNPVKYISYEDHREFVRRTHPERGDILISKDGTLGVTRVVETDVEFSIFVSIALVKPVHVSLSRYLGIAFSSPIVQRQMTPKGSGLVHIHLEDLRRDCIPLPPLSEQEKIADHWLRKSLEAYDLEAAIDLSLKQSTAQRQNILRAAFAGQLVPQDPNDEPASVLLDRIRAERGAQATLKPRARKARAPA